MSLYQATLNPVTFSQNILKLPVIPGVKDLNSVETKELSCIEHHINAAFARFQSGDQDAIEPVIREYSARLLGLIIRLTGSRSAADDILQETWIKVIRKGHYFDPDRPFFPWVSTIAVNCCRDYWRKEKLKSFWGFNSNGDSENFPEIPCTSFELAEFGIDVQKALLKLPRKYREVIVLRFYGGLTYDEIGECLNKASGTIKSRLHHALEKLRSHFHREVKHETM